MSTYFCQNIDISLSSFVPAKYHLLIFVASSDHFCGILQSLQGGEGKGKIPLPNQKKMTKCVYHVFHDLLEWNKWKKKIDETLSYCLYLQCTAWVGCQSHRLDYNITIINRHVRFYEPSYKAYVCVIAVNQFWNFGWKAQSGKFLPFPKLSLNIEPIYRTMLFCPHQLLDIAAQGTVNLWVN